MTERPTVIRVHFRRPRPDGITEIGTEKVVRDTRLDALIDAREHTFARNRAFGPDTHWIKESSLAV